MIQKPYDPLSYEGRNEGKELYDKRARGAAARAHRRGPAEALLGEGGEVLLSASAVAVTQYSLDNLRG